MIRLDDLDIPHYFRVESVSDYVNSSDRREQSVQLS